MTIRARFKFGFADFNLDVDLQLPSNQVSAIFGPSGSGKTSLLRAIAGLDRHSVGDCSLDNLVWQSSSGFVPSHQRSVAMVFQQANLFAHLTVAENIEYASRRAQSSKISAQMAIELLALENLLARKPNTLSGGERQRVAIARALAASPRLLLMDEPLSALDQTARQQILPFLETLHNELQLPIIYVSHSLEEVASIADYLVLLDDGQLSSAGPLVDTLTDLKAGIALADDAASIIETSVLASDDEYGLTYLQAAGARFVVSQQNLSIGSRKRIRVAARDVSIALERAEQSSILNIFAARIVDIVADGTSQSVVKLDLGGDLVLSRITRKSAAKLGLAVGQDVYLQIKSIALL